MATNNSINANSTGLVKYDGAGTFSGVTVTNHSLLVGAASNGITSLALTNGQLAIGSTGADPSAATLTAGTGVSISNGAGTITVNALGGGLTWTVVSGTSQAMAVNNGYIANNAGLVTMTLPATSAVGDMVIITGIGAGGWRLAQNAGNQVFFEALSTTAGAGGSISSIVTRDTLTLVCTSTNANWQVISSMGSMTIV